MTTTTELMSTAEILGGLVSAMATGRIRVVDHTQTLPPEFPQIALPPEMGQCWPFRIEEVSAYDERGPGWYWNNFSCGEHTGTHFDAPIHWISGRDLPNNSVDTIPVQHFVAPACVVDYVVRHATTYDVQERCVAALIRKTEILWHLLDCAYAAYIEPGWGPGGARAT